MSNCIRDRQCIPQCAAKHGVVEDCPDVERALAGQGGGSAATRATSYSASTLFALPELQLG
jgi:hypothetical protein